MRSRVMPGSSPTIARRPPVIRLNRVDFPTFGRPTITTVGRVCDIRIPRITGEVVRTMRQSWIRAKKHRKSRAAAILIAGSIGLYCRPKIYGFTMIDVGASSDAEAKISGAEARRQGASFLLAWR